MLGSSLSSGFNEITVTPIEVLVPSRIQPFGEPTFVLDCGAVPLSSLVVCHDYHQQSHVAAELSTGIEKGLGDLSDGAVLDDVHHDLKQVATFSRNLLEPC